MVADSNSHESNLRQYRAANEALDRLRLVIANVSRKVLTDDSTDAILTSYVDALGDIGQGSSAENGTLSSLCEVLKEKSNASILEENSSNLGDLSDALHLLAENIESLTNVTVDVPLPEKVDAACDITMNQQVNNELLTPTDAPTQTIDIGPSDESSDAVLVQDSPNPKGINQKNAATLQEEANRALARDLYDENVPRLQESYSVVKPLGQGGQGATFLILDRAMARYRVLKVLPEDKILEPDIVTRFIREGRQGSDKAVQESHPYVGVPIAPVVGFVDCSNVREIEWTSKGIKHSYADVEFAQGIVQEYIGGPTLTEVIAEYTAKRTAHLKDHGYLSKELIVERNELIETVLANMEVTKVIHDEGGVHRDIKPENIKYKNASSGNSLERLTLKQRYGPAFTLDFGLMKQEEYKSNVEDLANEALSKTGGGAAQLSKRNSSVTQQGAVMGTLLYISPEQAKNSANVTAISDIYSYGCIIYEILSGRKSQLDESLPRYKAHHEKRTWQEDFLLLQEGILPIDPPSKLTDSQARDASVTSELDACVMKMLAPNPLVKNNYVSIDQATADIRAALDPNSGFVPTAYVEKKYSLVKEPREAIRRVWYQAWKWKNRNPKTFAVSLLMTVTAIIGWLYLLNESTWNKRQLEDSRAALYRTISSGELGLAERDASDLRIVAGEKNFPRIAAEAGSIRDALQSINLALNTYDTYGISCINPLRRSPVRSQEIIDIERRLAWLVAASETRGSQPAEHAVAQFWHRDFAKKFNAVLATLPTLEESLGTEIRNQAGTLLFGVAVEASAKKLYVPRSEGDIRFGLELFDEVAELWGDEGARVIAQGRLSALSDLSRNDAKEQVAALNAALNGRLSSIPSNAERITIDALLQMNRGFSEPNYQEIVELLRRAQEMSPRIEDEYVWSLAMAEAIIKGDEGERFDEATRLLDHARRKSNESTPFSLMIQAESYSSRITLYTPRRLESIIADGIRADAETLDTAFHIEYSHFLIRNNKQLEALEILESAQMIDQKSMQLSGRSTRNLGIYIEVACAKTSISRDHTEDAFASLQEAENVLSEYGTFGEIEAPSAFFTLSSMYALLSGRDKKDDEKVQRFGNLAIDRLKIYLRTVERLGLSNVNEISENSNYNTIRNSKVLSKQLESIQTRLLEIRTGNE